MISDALEGFGLRPLGEIKAETFALTGNERLSLGNALTYWLLFLVEAAISDISSFNWRRPGSNYSSALPAIMLFFTDCTLGRILASIWLVEKVGIML